MIARIHLILPRHPRALHVATYFVVPSPSQVAGPWARPRSSLGTAALTTPPSNRAAPLQRLHRPPGAACGHGKPASHRARSAAQGRASASTSVPITGVSMPDSRFCIGGGGPAHAGKACGSHCATTPARPGDPGGRRPAGFPCPAAPRRPPSARPAAGHPAPPQATAKP